MSVVVSAAASKRTNIRSAANAAQPPTPHPPATPKGKNGASRFFLFTYGRNRPSEATPQHRAKPPIYVNTTIAQYPKR